MKAVTSSYSVKELAKALLFLPLQTLFELTFRMMLLTNVISKDAPWRYKKFLEKKSERDYVTHQLGEFKLGLTLRLKFTNYRTKYRSMTLLTKEPETIHWIRSFGSNREMLDIGANIGIYSVFFSAYHESRCFAFEPSPDNCTLLLSNIEANNLNKYIYVLPIALSKSNCIGELRMPNRDIGHSFLKYNESAGDFKKTSDALIFGTFSFTLDTLYDLGIIGSKETIIKLDVDGTELSILIGAQKLLKSGLIYSILIENSQELISQKEVDDFLYSCDFRKLESISEITLESQTCHLNNSIWLRV